MEIFTLTFVLPSKYLVTLVGDRLIEDGFNGGFSQIYFLTTKSSPSFYFLALAGVHNHVGIF